MTDRELDAYVAEKVMGWHETRNCDGRIYGKPEPITWPAIEVPHYTTDAAADCLVLEQVREAWSQNDQDDFCFILRNNLYQRDRTVPRGWAFFNYHPGDYTRAAYETLKAKEGGEA